MTAKNSALVSDGFTPHSRVSVFKIYVFDDGVLIAVPGEYLDRDVAVAAAEKLALAHETNYLVRPALAFAH
jgi:hypothetical protein